MLVSPEDLPKDLPEDLPNESPEDLPPGWIVCPAYNESQALNGFVRELEACVAGSDVLSEFRIILLIVDDGSADDTAGVARALGERSSGVLRVESISLTRNFGQQAALIAGLDLAARRGAAWVCTMDADGEHPVKLLPTLVETWQGGAPLVHTVRSYDARVSAIKRGLSGAYYFLLQRISNVRIGPGMADYKLWDGELLRQVQPFLPHCGLLRLFASWLCPDAPVIPYAQEFVAGRPSRFTWRKMFSIGFSGLVRYSEMPLRFFLLAGVLSFAAGVGIAIFAAVSVAAGKTVPGWASILMLVSGFGALQSLSLGVLAEYFVRLMFRRSLPTYVTRKSTLPGAGSRR
jgi:glycosyltransferase involved in cell wall biosynthesis